MTLILSFVLASCAVRINYLGSTSAPTENVDVYVDPSAIKRPYTIIGKGYPASVGYGAVVNSTDKLQRKAVELAREKGANAVLFQDYQVQHNGTNFYAASRTDSLGKGVITTTSGSVAPIVTSGRNIFFLRYD
ncbi:MAG TPA: hypothetical protein VF609_11280 [Flavisolibacter sp.]